MKYFALSSVLACMAAVALAVPTNGTVESGLVSRADGHTFTFVNRCGSNVDVRIADTRCGYSPRCSDAVNYSGPQPGTIGAGKQVSVTINDRWVGRIFNKISRCGAKGESCTIGEFNLDSPDQFTPQSYDISNIQGFTQSISISAQNCETVTCTNVNCPCKQAYRPNDQSGCGNDSPVRACGAGRVPFTVTFCP